MEVNSPSAQDLDEVCVLDHALVVDIGFAEEVVNLVLVQLLTDVRQYVAQLGGVDQTVAVTVKDLEGLLQLLLGVLVACLRNHKAHELDEVNNTVTVCIY